MRKKFFACLFYFITTVYASDTDFVIQNRITIAQILATPRLFVFIGGQKQVAVWKELIRDLITEMESFPSFNKILEEPTIHFLKSIIHSGFQPHNFEISEQALVAVMFFIRSINQNQKTIQTFLTNKNYYIKKFECWNAINDHLFFAQLIADGKISCININKTAVYHPINFDYEETPSVIQTIARVYGPFFQDINLNKELKTETQNPLISYAHLQRDPRTYNGAKEMVFLKFPYERYNTYQPRITGFNEKNSL